MKKKDINYYRICDLFRKVITSLVCIEYKISNESIKEEIKSILEDFVNQYELYSVKSNSNLIGFKYSEKQITEFANNLYDNIDVFNFAEDLEFGFSELVKYIMLEREKKNEC